MKTTEPASPLPWASSSFSPEDCFIDCHPSENEGHNVAQFFGPDAYQNAAYAMTACNAYPKLVNALESAESLLRVDFATPETVEGRRALSFVNALRTLLSSLEPKP